MEYRESNWQNRNRQQKEQNQKSYFPYLKCLKQVINFVEKFASVKNTAKQMIVQER
jgi:hypothetical protein